MESRKSIIWLLVGLLVGVLLGSHLHTTALATSRPCGTPTPSVVGTPRNTTPTTGAHRIRLLVYVASTSSKPDNNNVVERPFTVRGPFTLRMDYSAIDPNKMATGGGGWVENATTGLSEFFSGAAIDVHEAPQVVQVRFTDMRCQIGCTLDVVEGKNLRWAARVEQ